MLKATNLMDQYIQQHVFGDILKRSFELWQLAAGGEDKVKSRRRSSE